MEFFSRYRPQEIADKATSFPPHIRRLLLIGADILLLPLAVWISFWLRLAHPFHSSFQTAGWWMLPSVLLVGLTIYSLTGQYSGLTRYVGSKTLYQLAGRNFLLVLVLIVMGVILKLSMPPRSSWILLWLILTGLTSAVRFTLRDFLHKMYSAQHEKTISVAIYGAGQAGAQLAAALHLTGNHKVLTFLDDNPNIWNRSINGISIRPPNFLYRKGDQIDQVLLAIPSLSRRKRREIVGNLQHRGVSVMQVPSVDDLTSGRAQIDALRPIAIEDLLGRDPLDVDPKLLNADIRSAVVCVTGAGGSIGSELCLQILTILPAKLILLERSEPSLYALEQKLQQILPDNVKVIPVLGSANDKHLMECLFNDHGVEMVFHAAAYKHVPLIEDNPLAGLKNNVGSTIVVCRAAVIAKVKKVILISTDKAVRPTNIMGASKRLAELIVQAFAQENTETNFSMVRFGNVLGSSGSVVPLFSKQIAEGGPITLTHEEIIRYFMTIPEAAKLVLQASVFAEGGEVFLLDMGEPVRIRDLAEQMVRLCGLTLRDRRNPNGDIEIICTGLRPGEKLFEELLIEAKSEKTAHPLIYKAIENSISPRELWPQIQYLEKIISNQDVDGALKALSRLVPEWDPTKNKIRKTNIIK